MLYEMLSTDAGQWTLWPGASGSHAHTSELWLLACVVVLLLGALWPKGPKPPRYT